MRDATGSAYARVHDIRCWESFPSAPARNCTHPPGHEGDHHHEYTGVSWPPGEPPNEPRTSRPRRSVR